MRALLGEWAELRTHIIALARSGQREPPDSLSPPQAAGKFSQIDSLTQDIAHLPGRAERFVTEANEMAATEFRHDWLLLVTLNALVVLITFLVTRRISKTLRNEADRREPAEAATRASDERLRTVIDATADAIIVITADGLLESANPAVEGIFGYRPDELVGRNISMLMPEPDRSRHDGYLAAYRDGGERKVIGFRRELTAQRKDGRLFPIELAVSETGASETGSEGGTRYVGIMRDISATVDARTSSSGCEHFTQCIPRRADRQHLHAGPQRHHHPCQRPVAAACPGQRPLRRTRRDSAGDYLVVSEAPVTVPATRPPDRPRATPGARRQGRRVLRRIPLSTSRDPTCWMMLSATSFDADGERWVVIAHEDITELRDSQHELASKIDSLHTTLETMRQGILMVDRDLNVITVNRSYFELMQLPPEFYDRKLTMADLIRYQAQRGDYGPATPRRRCATVARFSSSR